MATKISSSEEEYFTFPRGTGQTGPDEGANGRNMKNKDDTREECPASDRVDTKNFPRARQDGSTQSLKSQ